MNPHWRAVVSVVVFFGIGFAAAESTAGSLFSGLFTTITNALVASGANGAKRPVYPSESNGISTSVYGALQTITRNDDLECVPRLLCEAVAGGHPGGSRQINIDKYSLSKLVSYLQLDPTNSSPMLTFGKAAILGLSNRGDPYACIINYPKCPKDETRLLYYLNNHRGGFFRFFDMKLPHQNYQYGQNSYYTRYPTTGYDTYKPNQYYNRRPGNYLAKGTNYLDTYAKGYGHSKVAFPGKDEDLDGTRKVAFPSEAQSGEPRIQTKVVPQYGYSGSTGTRPSDDRFVFSSNRYGKTLSESSFFPNEVGRPAQFVTDRLPSKFYFPEGSGYHTKFSKGQLQKNFFPQ